jgi:hypothetical protein
LINSLSPFPGSTVTCLKLGDICSCIFVPIQKKKKHSETEQNQMKKQVLEFLLFLISCHTIKRGIKTARKYAKICCKRKVLIYVIDEQGCYLSPNLA